jgi:hypothetical protein
MQSNGREQPMRPISTNGVEVAVLYAVANAPFVVPPLGGPAADFRLKPVLRTCVISSRVQYNF